MIQHDYYILKNGPGCFVDYHFCKRSWFTKYFHIHFFHLILNPDCEKNQSSSFPLWFWEAAWMWLTESAKVTVVEWSPGLLMKVLCFQLLLGLSLLSCAHFFSIRIFIYLSEWTKCKSNVCYLNRTILNTVEILRCKIDFSCLTYFYV